MRNSAYRANSFAVHTGNIAGSIYRDGIEITGEILFLRAYCNACPAINAGIPPDLKHNGFIPFHINLLLTLHLHIYTSSHPHILKFSYTPNQY